MKETEESKEYKELVLGNLEFRKKENNKISSSKLFNIYMLRSFKTLRMICDLRNYRHIIKANNTIVETYCTI